MTTAPSLAPPRAFFLYLAWVIAFSAMLGSLFFSEVMKLPPCALCWYQRIPMYALVVVLAVGIVLRDRNVWAYAWPLAGAGLALAIYHNLIYYGVIAEALAPCTQGVPCNTRQIEWLGFITIPLLGLLAFAAILLSLIVHKRVRLP